NKFAYQAAANTLAAMLAEQRYVHQRDGFRSPQHDHSSHWRLVEFDNLPHGLRIGHTVPVLLRGKLHAQKGFLLSDVPAESGDLRLARAGIELELKLVIVRTHRAARDIHGAYNSSPSSLPGKKRGRTLSPPWCIGKSLVVVSAPIAVGGLAGR